ncbi:hypothetical protein Hsero_2664 [Herbaspirillum seropedicae SmR1]|uniref:Uncharacterized protein n=1 Tax=Herbaspirillum seropedicae (strain SmR1) TaxID=757424 RepID=D8IXQ8_HERSS|nr:hypothetical protein Hsero_2664 [Herbaspirillum seropedicae SmR1]
MFFKVPAGIVTAAGQFSCMVWANRAVPAGKRNAPGREPGRIGHHCIGLPLQQQTGWRIGQPASGAPEGAHDDQQDHRAQRGRDDGGQDAAPHGDAQQAGQPAADDRADDTDEDVGQQAEAAALDQHAGQPASNRTDDQPCNESVFHDLPFPVVMGMSRVDCFSATATQGGQRMRSW